MRSTVTRALRRGRRLAPLLLVVLAACAGNAPQDTMDPKGPVARQIDNLINPVFLIAGVVFVLVQGLVLVAVIKFRDRPDKPEPVQIHGSTRLEVGWTLIPFLILAAISVPTIKTIVDLSRQPDNALEVTVIGHQFWWEYRYEESGVVTANELTIPAGRPVALRLESVDVIHSYWIPPLAGKTDVIPGRVNHMHFEADEPGTYLGQCTEFCGLSHGYMRARAIALEPAAFDAWVESQKQPVAEPAPDTAAANGRVLFDQKGCGGCHTVAGVSQGLVGPNLSHFASRTTFAGSIFDNNDSNLRKWLRNPPKEKPGSLMPNLLLTPEEITDLIAYLDTLN